MHDYKFPKVDVAIKFKVFFSLKFKPSLYWLQPLEAVEVDKAKFYTWTLKVRGEGQLAPTYEYVIFLQKSTKKSGILDAWKLTL